MLCTLVESFSSQILEMAVLSSSVKQHILFSWYSGVPLSLWEVLLPGLIYGTHYILFTGPALSEHIVQVESDNCQYMLVNDRYLVSTPLHPPPPGEVASTLLLKLMCLTSCVGGPNRRPFCLVFTLRCKWVNRRGCNVLFGIFHNVHNE